MLRPGTYIRSIALKGKINHHFAEDEIFLDIGGFDGFISQQLKSTSVVPIILIDFDRNGLIQASRRGLIAVEASAIEQPFKKGSIEQIVCLDVIEHVEDDESLFQEIGRIIKPGGLLLISTTDINFSLPFIPMKWLNRKWGHVRNGYSFDDLGNLLGKSGFKIFESGKYFNILSRFAYSVLFFYRFPPIKFQHRFRIFMSIVSLEVKIKVGAKEHWIFATKNEESSELIP